jgi:malate permease and related proteins
MLGLEAIKSTIPLILLIILGIFFRKTKLLSPGTIRDFKTLIVRVTLPLLLFQAFCEMRYKFRFLLIIGLIFTACVLIFWFARQMIRTFHLPQRFFPFMMAGFEAGMLGYAMFGSIYGMENIPAFAVIDLGQVLFVFFILIPSLENEQGSQNDLLITMRNFVTTPVIIAILLGVGFNLSGIYLTAAKGLPFELVLKAISIVASLTTPLVAIVIGYDLYLKRVSIGPALATVLMRLLVWIPLAFLFNQFVIDGLLHLDGIYKASVLLMSILPAPFVVPIYLRKEESPQSDMILSTLSFGTIISLVGAVLVKMLYA